MSRRCAIKKREVAPDRKYNSQLLSKFINYVMKNGKKSDAERIVYKALDELEKEMNAPGLNIFTEALENVQPSVEMRSLRAGGVNYRIPVPVKSRGPYLGISWILSEARKKTGVPVYKKIALELADAHAKRGGAFKKYEENLKMAESGRAFSHFRFFNNRRG